MTTLVALTDRLRLELGDPAYPFQAQIVADGETDVFDLPVELVSTTDFLVALNGAPLDPSAYDMDYRAGSLTLNDVPADGDEVFAQGTHFETFLTSDLETFVHTAFLQHAHQRTTEQGVPMTLAELPPVEEYLVVLLAEIEALWVLITDAAMEIDVRNPDGVNIPVGQRYQQLLGLLAMKRAQYQELASALNVGIFRVEMFNLRRVSRTTNRLVPIYKAMEYDERPHGFWPEEGAVGTVVTVKGTGFTGTSSVLFNGVAAEEFTVVSDTLLQATVPIGATSGPITITTPGGVVDSMFAFTVGQKRPVITHGAAQQRIRPPIDSGLTGGGSPSDPDYVEDETGILDGGSPSIGG